MKNNLYKNTKVSVRVLDITIIGGIVALAILTALQF